ncbi:hypothetical protein IWQ62_000988 [Dispira parvispora]|uniref:Uncharacterized protein n=1 Tax=Dispira parvispora TaxID=1520584 RepID=A0A9W8AZ08_9FUNG|nr:hypothetical protein IWQ62_000988 [Dispira parvispora]
MKAYCVPIIIALCILATVHSTLGSWGDSPNGDITDSSPDDEPKSKSYRQRFSTVASRIRAKVAALRNSFHSSPPSDENLRSDMNEDDHPNDSNSESGSFLEKYESLMFGRGWGGVPFETADIKIISLLFEEEIRYSEYKHTHPLLTRTKYNYNGWYLVSVFEKQPLILAYVTGNWELVLKTLKTIDKLTDGMTTKEISPENKVLRQVVAMQVMTITAIAVFRRDYYLLKGLVAMMNDECKGFVDDAKFAVVAIMTEFIFPIGRLELDAYRDNFFTMIKESVTKIRKNKDVPAFDDCLRSFNLYIALGVIYEQCISSRFEDKDNKCSKYYFIGVATPTWGKEMRLKDFINGYAPPSQEGASDL